MLPYIEIFGFNLPTYGLMAVLGLAAAAYFSAKLSKVYDLKKQDLFFCAIYIVIGIVAGSKLLYVITNIPVLIRHFDELSKYPWETFMLMTSGFVFYGGLIGAMIATWIYAKQYKIDVFKFADSIAPQIPLFHAFGRIGCFLGGCCYGIEYHGFGAVRFKYNELVPELSEVERFPVQLFESGLNIIIFVVLFLYGRKKRKPGQTLGIYLVCYTIVRTVTECFRGDTIRGVTSSGLSTSQMISMLLLPLGLWFIIRKEKKVL